MARHCNECWERGHNKRTCPTLTERLLRYAKTENDTLGYWTKQYVERTGLNPDGSKAAQDSKPKQTRQCSWCKKSGKQDENGYYAGYDHNRRTCPHREEWHAEQKALAKEYRTEMLKRLKETGFGVGTLIKKTCWDYFPDEDGGVTYQRLDRVLMVTGMHWDYAHHQTNRRTVVLVRDIVYPKVVAKIMLPLEVELAAKTYAAIMDGTISTWRYNEEKYEVLSPSGSVATKPWGWENGESLTLEEPY